MHAVIRSLWKNVRLATIHCRMPCKSGCKGRYRNTVAVQHFLGSLGKTSNWSSNNTVETWHLWKQYRGSEYNTNRGNKHCIPTHFNTELDVSYANLTYIFKSNRYKFRKLYIVNLRGLEPGLRKMQEPDEFLNGQVCKNSYFSARKISI